MSKSSLSNDKNLSGIDSYFGLTKSGTNVKTEIIAGITTFITMAYVLFVHPQILAQANMDQGAVFVATCVSAAIGTFIMGLYANIPFAQAPGMGLNAFFTYSVVLTMGYTWQQALAAVFCSGVLFIIITLTSIREKIVDAIPKNLKFAISGGIGLFIALLGFKNGGIIVASDATLITFGNFKEAGVILTLIGLVITVILMCKNVKGAMLISIIVTTLIGIPMGITKIAGAKLISLPPSIAPTFMKMDFKGLLNIGEAGFVGALMSVIMVVISFSLVDMFDTIGTLVGTAQKAGMVDENGKVHNLNQALMADAVATTVGAVLGTSTVTTYVESTAGVAEGGKTGLTSVVTGILFLLALFFSGIAGIVPSQATAPALIVVGVLMIGSIAKIDFSDFSEAVPAFLTIAIMPFSYSIANGIAAGLIFYPITKLVTGQGKKVSPIVYILAALFIIRFIYLA